mgnify:CR=1 FL=1
MRWTIKVKVLNLLWKLIIFKYVELHKECWNSIYLDVFDKSSESWFLLYINEMSHFTKPCTILILKLCFVINEMIKLIENENYKSSKLEFWDSQKMTLI